MQGSWVGSMCLMSRGRRLIIVLRGFALLEIDPPEESGVRKRMEECKNWGDDKWEELLAQVCVEGSMWQGGSHMLLRPNFKPYGKAWASFVVQTLEGTTCTSEIP